MKYTRYDLRRKNDNKAFIVIMLLVFILAFVLGTAIFKLLIKNTGDSSAAVNNGSNITNSKNESKTEDNLINNTVTNDKFVKFIAVQGGVYQNKENVEGEKNILAQYGAPFTVVEDNKTRVFLGIYSESQGEQVIKSLLDQKVDNSKMVFTINKNDICDAEIIEIISANTQILNKLSEKNVKAIQTDELKKWCSSLKKVDNDSKNIAILNDLKENVNKMPKELTKDKVAENYAYIYDVLKRINGK